MLYSQIIHCNCFTVFHLNWHWLVGFCNLPLCFCFVFFQRRLSWPVSSFTLTVPACLWSWQYWQPTGVADLTGPRRTESCGATQNASAATGIPPYVHRRLLILSTSEGSSGVSNKTWQEMQQLSSLLNILFDTDKLCILSWRHSLCGEGNQHIGCGPLDYNHHFVPGHPYHQGPWWFSLCATSGDPVQAGESKPHCGWSYSSSQSTWWEEPAQSPEPGWASNHTELPRNGGHFNRGVCC